MAVPKKKVSQVAPRTCAAPTCAEAADLCDECPNCGELKRPHHVCGACGHYDGREVAPTTEARLTDAGAPQTRCQREERNVAHRSGRHGRRQRAGDGDRGRRHRAPAISAGALPAVRRRGAARADAERCRKLAQARAPSRAHRRERRRRRQADPGAAHRPQLHHAPGHRRGARRRGRRRRLRRQHRRADGDGEDRAARRCPASTGRRSPRSSRPCAARA